MHLRAAHAPHCVLPEVCYSVRESSPGMSSKLRAYAANDDNYIIPVIHRPLIYHLILGRDQLACAYLREKIVYIYII